MVFATTSLVHNATEKGPQAMKASLKAIAGTMKQPRIVPTPEPPPEPSYRTAQTRTATRQISGHFPAEDVQAFRVLAATLDMDVQEF